MKLFFKLLFIVIVLEIIVAISCTFIIQETSIQLLKSFCNIIIIFLSFPLYLIDRTYPFYAHGPAHFGFMITLINVLLQTSILYAFIRIIRKK